MLRWGCEAKQPRHSETHFKSNRSRKPPAEIWRFSSQSHPVQPGRTDRRSSASHSLHVSSEGETKLGLERPRRCVQAHFVCRNAAEVGASNVEVRLTRIGMIQDVIGVDSELEGLGFGQLE